jgi:hypothetical protein
MNKMEWNRLYHADREKAERLIKMVVRSVEGQKDVYAALRAETQLRCGVAAPEDFLISEAA